MITSAVLSIYTSAPPPPRPVPSTHKRTYQACIPCRQRKVRCDLGSVESPHDPPCVRCRRESKCFFSATRRKRTPPGGVLPCLVRGGGGVVRKREDAELSESGDHIKRSKTGELSDEAGPQFRSPEYGGMQQQSPRFAEPLIDPQLRQGGSIAPPPPQAQITTADTILQSEVYNSHEALLTLIEAAGKDTPMSTVMTKSESRDLDTDGEGEEESIRDDITRTTASAHSGVRHSPTHAPSVRWGQSTVFGSKPGDGTSGSRPSSAHARKGSMGVSPRTQNMPRSQGGVDLGMEKALRSWKKFRFVKAGWFTAREAVDFVEYYFHQLHPLSPTLTNPTLTYVSEPRYHHLLLRHEPFLATAILTAASRYMILAGPGGQSRSFAIHDMLWREIRNAFERIMWGGGWGGLGIPKPIGAVSNMPVDPANGATTGRGLRTLGTVEALMILTEWHVRGIHFPMDVEESDWGIEVSDDEDVPTPKNVPHQKQKVMVEGLGDRLSNILEPAYRSDRMCWMLLGNALSLAYELGVFDENGDDLTPVPTPPATVEPVMPFRVRSKRIQRLLLVYTMQLASRLGWTSMIPPALRDTIRRNHCMPNPQSDWSNPDALQDAVFSTWVDLTVFMTSSAETLFPSRSVTRALMRSGQYVVHLECFRPQLEKLKMQFMALKLPAPIHHILVLEYEHVRFYINSLALQAVVDRCSQSSAPSVALSEMSQHDLDFIREVVDAARSLLSVVVKQMYPSGFLRHAPARVYFRILSASMFLLKTFALGAKEVEVKESMELLETVCHCLRDAAVDDLHLGLRFADILHSLAGRVRTRFVRMPGQRESRAATPSANELGGGSYAESPHVHADANGVGGEEAVKADDELYPNGWTWPGEDWLALPLDPILGFEGVTQGTMGVDVGGMDLLEVLLAGADGSS
ncbi:hypothetical protein EDC01DRAFT_486051 [Geopyxis carbonaria]|nr:hypothetical protein EDC01DRAFT_486051 [Geopyxis carbonaria]